MRVFNSCDSLLRSDLGNLYATNEVAGLPADAVAASLGCGNPTALAQLNAGRRARSGIGRRGLMCCFRRSAWGQREKRTVWTDGRDAGAGAGESTESGSGERGFLKGEIENIPLPENSVDVVVSNCVINLSGDKDRVLREAFRVLRPDGRFAVSDVVVRGAVPAEIRRNVELWVGCVAGALEEYGIPDEARGGGI